MQKVNGFFTGEVLCEKLISEISAIKILKENVADKIVNAVKIYKKRKVVESSLSLKGGIYN